MSIIVIIAIILSAMGIAIVTIVLVKCINSSNKEIQRLKQELDYETRRAIQISYQETDALACIKSLQASTTIELARADHIARMITNPMRSGETSIDFISTVIPSTEFNKELPRGTTLPKNAALSNVIDKEVNEEIIRLEQGMVILHQTQAEIDQTVSNFAIKR